jgi:hypothetical protein
MFGFLKKKDDSVTEESNAVEMKSNAASRGNQLSYNPNLIEKLKGDHQVLLGVYGEIKAASDARNFPLVIEKLQELKRGFMDHILTENVSLYVYMKNSFNDDDASLELVQGFRSEMDGIGKVVRAFITKYETIGVDSDLAASFAEDLAGIGAALVARIEREEGTLYPLYH